FYPEMMLASKVCAEMLLGDATDVPLRSALLVAIGFWRRPFLGLPIRFLILSRVLIFSVRVWLGLFFFLIGFRFILRPFVRLGLRLFPCRRRLLPFLLLLLFRFVLVLFGLLPGQNGSACNCQDHRKCCGVEEFHKTPAFKMN